MADIPAEHYDQHERDLPDDEHEWSRGGGDSFRVGKPARLFVFSRPAAREIDGGQSRDLLLDSDDIRFLLDVLPKALELREVDDGE